MAVFETTRPLAHGISFGERLSNIAHTLFGTLAAWNDARVTRNALSKLTDRELDDIGLTRADIEAMM
ncbi:DUF1127 domain-containing protein [Aliiroseovarius subalbicans]|uniref:DUF1127 domain-containing protein n=1 Tax=Aliiroseovarius subalbicans TaxID=2925840 RepID=UPI001F57D07A|nr:DUF1127 domain-containing protein [Aliiroseovarius subalbicans]MCI2397931.1 DUF1127 domain-containing protein [Aliiroseovarius subalbicans]